MYERNQFTGLSSDQRLDEELVLGLSYHVLYFNSHSWDGN